MPSRYQRSSFAYVVYHASHGSFAQWSGLRIHGGWLVVLLGFLVLPRVVAAQEGFGADGLVVTSVSSGNDLGNALAVQSDGKIVVAGSSENSSDSDFALLRYDPDGTLDGSFGNDGIVVTDRGNWYEYGRGVALQSDGKILVAGAHAGDFALLRYDADGTLDDTFGDNGMATGQVTSSTSDEGRAVVLQSDGKIVVAGHTYSSNSATRRDVALMRFDSDGSLDPSFGNVGVVTTAVGSYYDAANAVTVQSDGKLVVASYHAYDLVVLRYDTDGSLDGSFGGDGIVTASTGASTFDSGNSILVQSNGKIVVAGYSEEGSDSEFMVVRFNTNGTLDTSFSGDGIVTTSIGTATDRGLAAGLQSDGKVVVAGITEEGTGTSIAVARYTANGTLDPGFGGDGIVTTSAGSEATSARAVFVDGGGRVIVTGQYDDDVVLALYDSDGTSLPVELAAFTAAADGREVLLRWQTASETNNAGFEVQQRRGAAWQALAFVEGRGTTLETQSYAFTAAGLAPGTHRFRLRQVDADGASAYSPEVEVRVGLLERYLLTAAYPNPSAGRTQLSLSVAQAQPVRVAVYDALGRQVRVLFEGVLDAGEARPVVLDAAGLPAGLYLVRVQGEHFTATRSVVLAAHR